MGDLIFKSLPLRLLLFRVELGIGIIISLYQTEVRG